MSTGTLEGSNALIAGGGRGIGEAVTRALADAGATVAVLDREMDEARRVCADIESAGGKATAHEVDLLDNERIDAAVGEALGELGRIDVLANVAGGMVSYVGIKPVHEWTQDEWDLVIGLNLSYVFRICKTVVPAMIDAGGGSIVNIVSTAGHGASPRMAPYGAAKAGLMQLTGSMAAELGHHGIRVNGVSPGSVATPATMGKAVGDTFDDLTNNIPLGRRGEPSDIADAVVFLASDKARYITGQTLAVDGGLLQRFQFPLPGAHPSEGG